MPIIPQILNINNSRTTIAKSINLHTIRKLIEYSLKKFDKGNVYSYRFGILMSEGRPVLSPAQRGTGTERVNQMLIQNLVKHKMELFCENW